MLNKLWLDFETYYDSDYTLRKMTPIEYILDPRFEALGCGFINDREERTWIDGPDLPNYLKEEIDWKQTWSISHNTLFDGLILSHRYGVVPAFYGDTLSMARNWISHMTGSVSLDACAKFYGLPAKWGTVQKTLGVNFHALQTNPALHQEVAGYALDDAGKCRTIEANMMRDGFPPQQLKIIDMVVRMASLPAFELDLGKLYEHLGSVQAAKQALLDRANLENRDNLMRDEALAAMLLFAGVTPPMKMSKAKGTPIYAFAKTDKEFTALLEHESLDVQAIVAARLGHKSTLEETRTERLIAVGRVAPKLPVPLKYSGAHTHRFSGDWKLNLQNLVVGGMIRKAIKAPKGKVVVSIDASQIEARLNATLSGQQDLMDSFRVGNDVYAEFAETVYHYKINKKDHPTERFVGKQGILGLGYGSSWPVFQNMCRNKGSVQLTDSEATSIVFLYRQRYDKIVANWKHAEQVVLPQIASETINAKQFDVTTGRLVNMESAWKAWGPAKILPNKLLLPSDNLLHYRDLHREILDGKNQWLFMRGPMRQHIYGAKLVENLIQALAFVHIMEVALRVYEMTQGLLRPAHQVHDELIYVVDANLAEMVRMLVVAEMSKAPLWMPNAPLAAEGHIGDTYGDAK